MKTYEGTYLGFLISDMLFCRLKFTEPGNEYVWSAREKHSKHAIIKELLCFEIFKQVDKLQQARIYCTLGRLKVLDKLREPDKETIKMHFAKIVEQDIDIYARTPIYDLLAERKNICTKGLDLQKVYNINRKILKKIKI